MCHFTCTFNIYRKLIISSRMSLSTLLHSLCIHMTILNCVDSMWVKYNFTRKGNERMQKLRAELRKEKSMGTITPLHHVHDDGKMTWRYFSSSRRFSKTYNLCTRVEETVACIEGFYVTSYIKRILQVIIPATAMLVSSPHSMVLGGTRKYLARILERGIKIVQE